MADSLTWPAADGFPLVALISFYVPAIKSKESGTEGSFKLYYIPEAGASGSLEAMSSAGHKCLHY